MLFVQMKEVIFMSYSRSHKHLKTMGINEAWPDSYDEIYTSIQTWTLSYNSVAAVQASSLKIFSNGKSLKRL